MAVIASIVYCDGGRAVGQPDVRDYVTHRRPGGRRRLDAARARLSSVSWCGSSRYAPESPDDRLTGRTMNRRSTVAVLIAATVLAAGAVALSAGQPRCCLDPRPAPKCWRPARAAPSTRPLRRLAHRRLWIGGDRHADPDADRRRHPTATVTDGLSPTPTITPTPDAQWWLAGGVDPTDVVGAWRAKGRRPMWPAS